MECGWFFFFKQKTAYEMSVSDWSSDVCSSDLDDVSSAVAEFVASRDWDLVAAAKDERAELIRQVRAEVLEALSEQYPPEYLKAALDDHLKSLVRKRIVGEGVRPDGRKPEEIRPISAEV